MMTISLCMIVKNEENTLEKCLNSVKSVVDEIVIIDTGSSDNTKEIASKFTNKILDFKWINDFSAARNFSFEQATMDYIMWLDADDIILPEDIKKLAKFKEKKLNEIDVVMMKYNTNFDQNGAVIFSYFRERIARRSRGFKWKEPVHEYLDFSGRIANADISVTHTKQEKTRSTRNIEIYDNLVKGGAELSPRSMYYYGRELREHGRYSDAITWFNLFLDSKKGWLEDKIAACGELAKCYHRENKPQEVLYSLLRSFEFDLPRAEICCQIGYYFKKLKHYKLAIFWFEMILSLERNTNNWGFQQEDCWGYIPCIECAVCYDMLGCYEEASAYNDRAAEYKPDSAAVLHNKKYFTKMLSNNKSK